MIEALAGDAYVRTRNILPMIRGALEMVGARTKGEVRTVIYSTDIGGAGCRRCPEPRLSISAGVARRTKLGHSTCSTIG
jgi:hypothetical protein